MFEQKAGNLRHVGVKLAEHGKIQKVAPMTLISVADLEYKLIEWGDEQGRAHRAVVAVFPTDTGPMIFLPPNSEEWTKALRPFNETLQQQFQAKLKAKSKKPKKAHVPEKDSVDVVLSEDDDT